MIQQSPSRSDHSDSDSDASYNDQDKKVAAAEGDSDSDHSINDYKIEVEVEKSAAAKKTMAKSIGQDEIQLQKADVLVGAVNDSDSESGDDDDFELHYQNAIDETASVMKTGELLFDDYQDEDIDQWDVASEGSINFEAKHQ